MSRSLIKKKRPAPPLPSSEELNEDDSPKIKMTSSAKMTSKNGRASSKKKNFLSGGSSLMTFDGAEDNRKDIKDNLLRELSASAGSLQRQKKKKAPSPPPPILPPKQKSSSSKQTKKIMETSPQPPPSTSGDSGVNSDSDRPRSSNSSSSGSSGRNSLHRARPFYPDENEDVEEEEESVTSVETFSGTISTESSIGHLSSLTDEEESLLSGSSGSSESAATSSRNGSVKIKIDKKKALSHGSYSFIQELTQKVAAREDSINFMLDRRPETIVTPPPLPPPEFRDSESNSVNNPPPSVSLISIGSHLEMIQRGRECLRKITPPKKNEEENFTHLEMSLADRLQVFHINEYEDNDEKLRGGNCFPSTSFESSASNMTSSDLWSNASHNSGFQSKIEPEENFAGVKDFHSETSTKGENSLAIRSHRGTVRGVKNRVRQGIATFLSDPAKKNYREREKGKVVVYMTTLGVLRETYARCVKVRQILRTHLVKVEEKDVFMSRDNQNELMERMDSERLDIPQVFVDGRHLGNADTVESLNERGELRRILKPFKSQSAITKCSKCGDFRMLPCPLCFGSKKSTLRNNFTETFISLRCSYCDDSALVKCDLCCSL